MGLHHHVRVSVDGKKIRSAGGDPCRWIEKDFRRTPDTVVQEHICHVPFDTQLHTLTFIFIKRHQSHVNRTIERIVRLDVVRTGRKSYEVHGTAVCNTTITLQCTEPAYGILHTMSFAEIAQLGSLCSRANFKYLPEVSKGEE